MRGRSEPGVLRNGGLPELGGTRAAKPAFLETPVARSSERKTRWGPNKKARSALWLAVGYTDDGRALTVPLIYDDSRLMIRPVTGWDSTDGEKTKYLKGRA